MIIADRGSWNAEAMTAAAELLTASVHGVDVDVQEIVAGIDATELAVCLAFVGGQAFISLPGGASVLASLAAVIAGAVAEAEGGAP